MALRKLVTRMRTLASPAVRPPPSPPGPVGQQHGSEIPDFASASTEEFLRKAELLRTEINESFGRIRQHRLYMQKLDQEVYKDFAVYVSTAIGLSLLAWLVLA